MRGGNKTRPKLILALVFLAALVTPAMADEVDDLISDLKDEDSHVRYDAASALGEIRDDRAVDPLTEALKDEDERVRNAASDALETMVIPTMAEEVDEVEDLILNLNDGDFSVRMQAANALGNIKDARAVDPLIEALKDESYFVRMAAAMALGRIGDGRAVEPLITYLNDECYHCSGYAVDALVAIGGPAVDPLIEALKDESSCVRQAAVEALGTIGDERAIDPLIAFLIDEDPDVRENAADALVAIGQPAIGPLTEALKDEDELVRNAATEVLQRIPVKKIRYEEAPSNIFEDKGIIGTADVSQLASVGITAADADGDGDPDVFIVSGDSGIGYFENVETDQGREFVYRGTVSTLDLNPLDCYDIVLTDIDQDGALELITASKNTNMILHENISNSGEILFENRGEIGRVRVTHGDGISITAGDVNNDCRQDIFTATDSGFAKVYRQRHNELKFGAFIIGEPEGRNVGIDTADLNSDGLLDAVTASKEDGVLYFRQIEYNRPKFETSTIQEPDDYPGTWRDLVLTDVDMDGDIDALITSTRDILYLENVGSVTEFEFVNRGVVGDPEANSYESANIIALDYDMDGDDDFIVATPDKLKLFENTIIDY